LKNKKITTKDFKKVTDLCKFYNTKVMFGYTGEGSEVDVEERLIVIDLLEIKNIRYLWSIVFHELAHIYCYDNDIYRIYHEDTLPEKEMAKYVRKMGLRIERYVDKIGSKLMKEHGFTFRYVPAYNNKKDVKWFRKWIEENYPM
jgi:hypothetical protein